MANKRKKRQRALNALRWRMWRDQQGRCPLCKEPIEWAEVLDREKVNIDHITSRAHGGPDARMNLQLVHIPCNERKGCGCGKVGGNCRVTDAVRLYVSPREIVWRKQGHRCLRCQQAILPKDVKSNQLSKFDGTELIHRTCVI